MEELIHSFKMVTYMVIIFSFINKAIPNEKSNVFVKYLAGFMIIISIAGPIMKFITGLDCENIVEEMFMWDEDGWEKGDLNKIEDIADKNNKMATDAVTKYLEGFGGE